MKKPNLLFLWIFGLTLCVGNFVLHQANGQGIRSSIPLPEVTPNYDLRPAKGHITKVPPQTYSLDYTGQKLFSESFGRFILWEVAGGNWTINSKGAASINSSKGNPSFLISPAIKLGNEKIKMIYREKYQIEDEYDFGSVWITDNEGKSWKRLHTVYGESDWRETVINLFGYQDKSIRVAFAMYSDHSVDGEGWQIENISLNAIESSKTIPRVSSFNAKVTEEKQATFSATMTNLNSQPFPFIFASVRLEGITEILDQSNFVACENGVVQPDFFEVTPPQMGGGVRLADIVFIQDNSGSMSPVQNAVRNSVIDFVNGLQSAGVDFALGLTRFGQSGGGQPIVEENGNLTEDANYFLNTVYARNVDNGGIEPGFDAIYASATQFAFRPGAQRIFIFIANEPSNGDFNATKAQALNILQQSSITFNAVIELFDNLQQENYGELATATSGGIFDVNSPNFDPILSQIITQVAGTYLIRYRSSNPVFDGTLREVEVKVDYDGEREIATGQYIPGAIPEITLTQATLDLLGQGHAQGTSFTIQAEITDAITPFVQSATLLYKSTNQSTYQSVAMSKAGNSDIWEGIIPGSVANIPGVDFYITATDGNVTSSLPSDDPVANPFQLAILPNVPPSITFTPISNLCIGEDFEVSAEIIDNTNQLVNTNLFYRGIGQLVYQDIALVNQGGSTYEATLSAANISSNGIEYYLEAEDDFGVRSQSGTPDNPYVATVSGITNVSPANQSSCNSATNTYSQELEITYSNPPAGSDLIVNGQVFSITSSPQIIELIQLPANGTDVDVTVSFSGTCEITIADVFTAPQNCGGGGPTQKVVSFTLVDAVKDKIIESYGQIENGTVINKVNLPELLSVLIMTDPEVVGSVHVKLEGPKSWERIENIKPYTLFENNKDDYYGMDFPVGKYTLTATPYTEEKAKGVAGIPLQVSFEIVEGDQLVSFTLLDADKDIPLPSYDPLEEGDVINKVNLSDQLGILVNPGTGAIGSVRMKLEGPKTWEQIENFAPYSLFQNDLDDYYGMEFPVGKYTLTATPYSKKNGKGIAGIPIIVTFEIVESQEILSFTLTDSDKGLDIASYDPLEEGDIIDKTMVPALLNIRANPGSGALGSIKFDLKGPIKWEQLENLLPYELFGDNKGREFPEGHYTLMATPYSQKWGKGKAGIPVKIAFEVVDDGLAIAFDDNQARFSNSQTISSRSKLGGAEEVVAYPIPFKNQFYLKGSQPSELQYSLIDFMGKEHKVNYFMKGQETAIDVTNLNLPAGLYFLKVQSEDGSIRMFKIQKY